MVRRFATLAVVLAAGAGLAGCGGQDLAGVGGAQILSFVDDLPRPVTFLYCPEQGCDSPLVHRVQPHGSWRIASETINGAGAISIRVGASYRGCRLVPAVDFAPDPLVVNRASQFTGVACVTTGRRPPAP